MLEPREIYRWVSLEERKVIGGCTIPGFAESFTLAQAKALAATLLEAIPMLEEGLRLAERENFSDRVASVEVFPDRTVLLVTGRKAQGRQKTGEPSFSASRYGS